MKRGDATAPTGPGLGEMSAVSASCRSLSSSGFSPLRTQNRKAVAPTPMASVIGLCSPRCSTSDCSSCSGRLAPPADAEDMLELAGGDDDARRGDEAGDHRVREEIGEKAQPEDTQQDQEHARQEGQRERGRSSSGVPGSAMFPTAAAVISETTATGPTASARLVPKIA
jgi:hypothetical protein